MEIEFIGIIHEMDTVFLCDIIYGAYISQQLSFLLNDIICVPVLKYSSEEELECT